MLEAVATPCLEPDSCWRPVLVPDGFPFVEPEAALVWAALLVLCLVALVHRLSRG